MEVEQPELNNSAHMGDLHHRLKLNMQCHQATLTLVVLLFLCALVLAMCRLEDFVTICSLPTPPITPVEISGRNVVMSPACE